MAGRGVAIEGHGTFFAATTDAAIVVDADHERVDVHQGQGVWFSGELRWDIDFLFLDGRGDKEIDEEEKADIDEGGNIE